MARKTACVHMYIIQLLWETTIRFAACQIDRRRNVVEMLCRGNWALLPTKLQGGRVYDPILCLSF